MRSFRCCLAPVRLGSFTAIIVGLVVLQGPGAAARESGDPIRLMWKEGDVAGTTRIWSSDGRELIGIVEYRQHRSDDRIEATRISRFRDGSSDEDQVEATVGATMEAVRGRSIIRDASGEPTVDLTVDVAAGRIHGFSGVGADRESYDEKVDLPPGTYWGPLIFIVVKNFEANASGGRVVFRTVAPTPKPRVIDLELIDEGPTTLASAGGELNVERISLRPTIHWLIDPIIQRIAPRTEFFIQEGLPPGLARFQGPRNYAGQEVRLE